MSEFPHDSSNTAADSSEKKSQTEAFKQNARDEALAAAEKGLQAAREALAAAERKLAEAQRNAAYDRAQQTPATGDDPVSVDFEDQGSERRDARAQAVPPTQPGFQPGAQSTAQTDYQPGAHASYPESQPGAQTAQPGFASTGTYQSAQSGAQGGSQQPPYNQGYQQPPVQPHYAAPYTTPKDHVAAGLLAIFLGFLGVHKFYLGYSTQGFIMLAISVLGGILSIGLATSIIWIIAIVEGIIYLSKSQSEFEQLYVYGKHEWF